jgi:hypothetical protein
MQLEPNLADGFHNKKGRSSISKVRPNISIYSHLAPVRQTPVQIWEVGQKNLWKKRKNPSIQNARKQLMRLALRQTHLYCYDKMSYLNTIDFRTPDLKITMCETTLQSLLRFLRIISRLKLQQPVIFRQHLHLTDGNGVEFCQTL